MGNKKQAVVTEFDLSAFPAPAVGRFRTDVGIVKEQARRLDWLLRCGSEEVNLEEVAELAGEIRERVSRVEDFAKRRAS